MCRHLLCKVFPVVFCVKIAVGGRVGRQNHVVQIMYHFFVLFLNGCVSADENESPLLFCLCVVQETAKHKGVIKFHAVNSSQQKKRS